MKLTASGVSAWRRQTRSAKLGKAQGSPPPKATSRTPASASPASIPKADSAVQVLSAAISREQNPQARLHRFVIPNCTTRGATWRSPAVSGPSQRTLSPVSRSKRRSASSTGKRRRRARGGGTRVSKSVMVPSFRDLTSSARQAIQTGGVPSRGRPRYHRRAGEGHRVLWMAPDEEAGAVVLGGGGDCCATNINLSDGTFYEGCFGRRLPIGRDGNRVPGEHRRCSLRQVARLRQRCSRSPRRQARLRVLLTSVADLLAGQRSDSSDPTCALTTWAVAAR